MPKYSEKQAEKAKNLSKKLANLLYRSPCCLILDEEKYFTYDGSNMLGNDNYYTNDISKCPKRVHFYLAIISSIEVRCSRFEQLYIRL